VCLALTSETTDGGAREFAHGCATEAKKGQMRWRQGAVQTGREQQTIIATPDEESVMRLRE